MPSRLRTPPSGSQPDAAMSPSPLSLGDRVRRAERRCFLLSYLAGGREGVPAPEVWEGLNELLREHAGLFGSVVAALPPEVCDEHLDA